MSKFKPSQKTPIRARPRPAAARVPPPTSVERGKSYLTPRSASGLTETAVVEVDSLADSQFQFAVANTTRKLALYCTMGFLFFRFSYLHELISGRFGIGIPFLLIVGALSCLACLISGNVLSGLQYRSVWMWLCFAICMCFATAFSWYRTGSLENILFPYLRTALPLVLLIPAVAYTSGEIRKLVDTIGIAGITIIITGLFTSDARIDRLELDTPGGTIQNANDYAMHMLLVLPAVAYYTMRAGRNVFYKVVGIFVTAAGLYELLGTGSRGGMLSLIITVLYILTKGSNRLRIGLLLSIPLFFAFALPYIPGEAAQRLSAFFGSGEEVAEASASQGARTALFKESLKITVHHPVLGIGPGEFQDYQGLMAAGKGERGMWHETHNGYTQVSSECGIPAIAFYLAAMAMTFRSLRRSVKAKVPILSPLAHTLSIMMVGYAVCLCFLSQGYTFAFVVLTGFSVSIERLLRQPEPLTY